MCLSRERLLVDARTVVYLNIAVEEKRSELRGERARIGRVGNITLGPTTIPIVAEPIARGKFLFLRCVSATLFRLC